MSFAGTMILAAGLAFCAKTAAWLLRRRTRNGGLVDVVWSWTLGGLAVLFAALGDAPVTLRVLVGSTGLLWGLRLGAHLWTRNWGKAEDFRYAAFRRRWGARANRNMFWLFQFQNPVTRITRRVMPSSPRPLAGEGGPLANASGGCGERPCRSRFILRGALVAWPFTLMLAASAYGPVVYREDMPPPAAVALAVAVVLVSILGEGIADAQMQRFRARPGHESEVCREGLWRFSRHPNYFFECLYWCAYVPLALAPGYAAGWLALFAPMLMACLLLRFSGMPLLEAEMLRRKPAYAEYIRTTSALVPLPPRRV